MQGRVLEGVGGTPGLGDRLSTGVEAGQASVAGKTEAGATRVGWGPRGLGCPHREEERSRGN